MLIHVILGLPYTVVYLLKLIYAVLGPSRGLLADTTPCGFGSSVRSSHQPLCHSHCYSFAGDLLVVSWDVSSSQPPKSFSSDSLAQPNLSCPHEEVFIPDNVHCNHLMFSIFRNRCLWILFVFLFIFSISVHNLRLYMHMGSIFTSELMKVWWCCIKAVLIKLFSFFMQGFKSSNFSHT